jgi:hypothetical protein
MKKLITKTMTGLAITTAALFSFPGVSFADSSLDWRLDGDIHGEYNSNLSQLNSIPISDFLTSYTGTGTLRYLAPTQTQVLARVQAQYNKFIKYNDFDVIVLAGSLTLSQWFLNTLNVYVGVQPIQQISTSTDKKPFDIDYLGGLTYYYPFSSDLLYGGYQIDRLNASAADFRALNHTFLVGLRHPFTSNLIGNVGARVRIRDLDITADDTRYTGNITAQYLITPWLTLQVGGEYTYVNSSDSNKTLGFYNFGINFIGGYNNGFKF